MRTIPSRGRPWSELAAELEAAKRGDFAWRDGRMALYFYFLDDEVMRVQQQAYLAYWTENAMGKRAFPSMQRLESEVLEMGLALHNAPVEARATFTSGGSESIFLALKTARDWAREVRGVRRANIVIPRTAHPGFDRAARFLAIESRRVPTTRADRRADPARLAAAIDEGTILLAGSAPNYPFGVFDPIADIAAVAESRGLWMHVDACVGGFLAPFVRRLGRPIPPFDFAVPGVTSISADLHKYGYAPKGASMMMLRDRELHRFQVFEFHDWERGAYINDTMQGTRPGGAVAGAWAVMNFLGEDGYRKWAKVLMDTVTYLADGIDRIEGLRVLRPFELCIFGYVATDPSVPIGAVAAGMTARGWFVGRLAEPEGIHLHLNPVHAVSSDRYLADLADAVQEARMSAEPALAGPGGSTY